MNLSQTTPYQKFSGDDDAQQLVQLPHLLPLRILSSLCPARGNPSHLWTDLWPLLCFSIPKTSRKPIMLNLQVPLTATAGEEVTVTLDVATQLRECVVVSRLNLRKWIMNTVRLSSHCAIAYRTNHYMWSQNKQTKKKECIHKKTDPQTQKTSLWLSKGTGG